MNADEKQAIEKALDAVSVKISGPLGPQTPMLIQDVLKTDDKADHLEIPLSVKEWRIVRFALERAKAAL